MPGESLLSPQDRRFSDTFLVVTPGITIRDRLAVLLPNLPGNYYVERDLVTADQLVRLGQARIHVTNFHALMRRDTFAAASLTNVVRRTTGRKRASQDGPNE